MSLVSVVVPVYNAEKTLEKCLDSIVAQTYNKYEIILVDDGSLDQSVSICEDYCKRYANFKLIKQENSGPASARNRGIENATGKYVYFIDSDDYVEPNLLETMVEVADENKADMVICNYFIEKFNGSVIEHKYFCEEGLYTENEALKLGRKLINDVSENRIPPYSWIRMINRKVLIETGIQYEDGMIRSEDYHFFVRLQFAVNRICVISKPLYHYVELKSSITHRYIPNYWKSVQSIYKSLKRYLPVDDDITNRLNIMLLQRTKVALNNSSMAFDKLHFKREIFEILHDEMVSAVIESYTFKTGVQISGAFYILMRCKIYWAIYGYYALKRRKISELKN